MNFTPYISFYFFLFSFLVYSQNEKQLIIEIQSVKKDSEIKKIGSKSKYNNDSITNFKISKIKSKLDSLGYLNRQIIKIADNDSIYHVLFKLQTPIKKIQIENPDLLKVTNKLNAVKNPVIISYTEYPKFIQQTIFYYQNNGFPFISITQKKVIQTNDTLKITLNLETGKQRQIDSIIIKGYDNFPKSFLSHQLNISKNDIYNKSIIENISTSLKSIPFVSEIKKPEILFNKSNSTLYLYLKEKKNNKFDGLIGFSSSENNTVSLNGYLNLHLNNTFNYGEDFSLNWISNGNKTQNLRLQTKLPYILQSPFSLGYNLSIIKRDSSYISNNNKLQISYPFTKNHVLGFTLSRTTSNLIQTTTSSNIDDFNAAFFGISYSFKKPDAKYELFPNKIKFSTQILSGNRNNEKQQIISSNFYYIFSINNHKNLVINTETKMLLSETYLNNEIFTIGGSNSIRGFKENDIYTRAYSFLNINYNYLLNNSDFFTVLSDIGMFQSNTESSLIVVPYSFGLGYNTSTKIGRLGIQYVIGNTNDNSFSFKNTKLHISFSQIF